MTMRHAPLAALLLISLAAPSDAQTIAISGGRVLTMAGPAIERGTVLIRDGKIVAVGADVRVPPNATIVDAAGKTVMPGIIDAMSYYGLEAADLNETAEPITPELNVLDGYTPTGREFEPGVTTLRASDVLSGGITAQYIAPADATLIGGQGAVVKTAAAAFAKLVVRERAAIDFTLGNVPTRTFRGRQRSPSTRAMSVALIRQALVRAQEYRRQWDDYAAKPDSVRAKTPPPGRQLGNEALVRLLKREAPARIQANTASDIRTAMRLAEEFGFEMILDSGSQAFELASELAAKKIPVVLGPVGHPFVSGDEVPDRDEYPAPDERSAARLTAAGVSVAIASFARTFGTLASGSTGRWLLQDATVAAGYGLAEDDVLRAITINPARILGVADRVGSLEPGKDADVIILSGKPTALRTWVDAAYVDGVLVFERKK